VADFLVLNKGQGARSAHLPTFFRGTVMVIIIGDNNCNDYVMMMIIVIIMHVMVFRLVTCSCHGKGPSDSDGGAEKKNLRHCEFKRQIELNSTGDAYNQNKRDLDKVAIFLTTPKPKLLSIASFFSKKKHDPKLPPVLTRGRVAFADEGEGGGRGECCGLY
jgi:hypothetical protein